MSAAPYLLHQDTPWSFLSLQRGRIVAGTFAGFVEAEMFSNVWWSLFGLSKFYIRLCSPCCLQSTKLKSEESRRAHTHLPSILHKSLSNMIFKSPITRPKLHWAAPRRQTLPSSAASPCRDNTLPTSSTKNIRSKHLTTTTIIFSTHIFYFIFWQVCFKKKLELCKQ